jgi:hypothetical protein
MANPLALNHLGMHAQLGVIVQAAQLGHRVDEAKEGLASHKAKRQPSFPLGSAV